MNYYKIVKNVKGILYSANYSGMKEYGLTNYCVTYDVGQKTVPKIKHTKLFCFTDLQTAHDFKSMLKPDIDGVLEIYECEVENPSSKNVGRYLYMLDGIKNWFQKKDRKSVV